MGDRYTPETHDKDFFKNSFCENEKKFKNKSSSLTILHSYAGHGIYGGYLGLLPDSELFSYPEYINKKNFLGRDHRNFKNINEYDTAINYIDETLEEVFNCSINKLPKSEPIVFIYFSDHGESPASMRGHDASRLTYEMLHVPFFIYFNDEAKKIFKEKFDFLKKLSTTKLTLKSLSDILIYLYDIDVKENKTNKVLYSHDSFNSLKTDYIVVRKDLDGKIEKTQTFFHYKGKSINNEISEKQFAYNDTSINLWQINNFLETNNIKNTKKINNLICRHRANSFIMQYVASLSIGCFETDVYFFDDKVISAHGIENDTGLEINDFLKSSYKKNTLWLDSKNLYSKEKCILARNWLEKKSQKFESLLVEIPTQSISNYNDIEWIQCINNINMIDNVQVGYYMPVNYLNDCNNNKIEAYLCNKELQKIISFLKKTNISSITFDYQVYDLINDFNSFSSYKWHIWHVNKLDDLAKLLKLNNLGIILLTNNKFTNNLN